MLAEQIHNSNPDQPEGACVIFVQTRYASSMTATPESLVDHVAGRVMADCSSMFICYILELVRWSGDSETLDLYYPMAKRAAEWQMSVSKDLGVPVKLETTYDSASAYVCECTL